MKTDLIKYEFQNPVEAWSPSQSLKLKDLETKPLPLIKIVKILQTLRQN